MNYCNPIILHAYPYGNYSMQTKNAHISSIEGYRMIAGKDVWITETGQESACSELSQQEQAKYLNEGFALMQSQKVKAYIWYEL